MLTSVSLNQQRENKKRFIELLRLTEREGVEDLIKFLKGSDFFEAPASTKFHGSFEGGLCAHSLSVYDFAKTINDGNNLEIPEDSLILATLLHDLAKVNYYERTYRNVKVYTPEGRQYDEGGNYRWEAVKSYKIVDDPFIFVNHESTSEYIARLYIDLKLDESAAIMSHHGGVGWDSVPIDAIIKTQKEYPLSIVLHAADSLAACLTV